MTHLSAVCFRHTPGTRKDFMGNNPTPPGKYCAYLRKSRADHDAELRGEGDTLERHRKLLSELSVRMKLPILKFYSEVVSGDTLTDRPVMQQLLRDVEAKLWEGVFVVEVERLARGNTKDQGIVSDCFKYSGTKIITPAKVYDPENEFDEEYFEFGLFMARREYKTINRRLQRGRIASVKEGKFVSGTAPYGYRRIRLQDEKGYTLAVNEKEADVIRMIFDWYCNGILLEDGTHKKLGADGIARRLDELGIPPRTSDRWSRATIRDMLSNPAYCGDVRFGYRASKKTVYGGTVTHSRHTNENCQQNPGLHPAIVSRSLFHKAQGQKTENRKYTVPSSSALQNPLSGLIYCKKCGSLMTRLAPNSHNPYATLKCPRRSCPNISSPLFLVEEQMIRFLRNWLGKCLLNPLPSDYTEPAAQEIERLNAALKNNRQETARLQAQLNKTYSLLEQEIYTIEIFRERQQLLTRDMETLAQTANRWEEEVRRYEKLRNSNRLSPPQTLSLFDLYSCAGPEAKNRLLKELMQKAEYEKDRPNTRGKLRNANFTLEIYPKMPRRESCIISGSESLREK